MEPNATILKTLYPLREGSQGLYEERQQLTEGQRITVGLPVNLIFNHRDGWYVPLIVDDESKRYVPQDSVYPD
jgi:hypothetical protein